MSTECIFCNDDFDLLSETNLFGKTCGCKYSFHQVCIDQWFNTGKHECIMCHSHIPSNTSSVPKFDQMIGNSDNFTVDYVYLDAVERREFASHSFENLTINMNGHDRYNPNSGSYYSGNYYSGNYYSFALQPEISHDASKEMEKQMKKLDKSAKF